MSTLFTLFICAFLTLIPSRISSVEFSGFYTPEYETYTPEKQTISVVFTLEAPFFITKQIPLSLSTVLDVSGSLRGLPIELLKGTTHFLTNKLTEEGGGFNDLGIVTYNDEVRELTPVVSLVPSIAEELNFYISQLVADGGTNLAGGLNLGLQQQSYAFSGKFKSVYLFTDGIPTVGLQTLPDILNDLQSALQSANDYISVSTFGFGHELNLDLLAGIVDVGGGEMYIISHPEDIPAAFGKALGGLLSVVATQLEIQFTTFPGCSIRSIKSGGVYGEDSSTITYPNIYASEHRDILFEVELDVGLFGFFPCLQADYVYVDPTTGQPVKGGQFVFEVERAPPPVKVVVLPAVKVEGAKLRYVSADACALAREKLIVGDRVGAVEILAKAEAEVEVSKLIDFTEIKSLFNDIKKLKDEIDAKSEATIEDAAKIGQLEVALKKQRSTSPESALESEKAVETESQKTLLQEIITTVLAEVNVEVGDQDGDSDAADEDEDGDVDGRASNGNGNPAVEDNDQEDETDGDGGASDSDGNGDGDGDAVDEDDDQEDETDGDEGVSDGDGDAVDEDNDPEDKTDGDGGVSDGDGDAMDEDNDQEDETDGDGGASDGDGDAVDEDNDPEDETDGDKGVSDGDGDAVDEDNDPEDETDGDEGVSDGDGDAVDEDNDPEDETDGDGGASDGDGNGDAVDEDNDQEDETDGDGNGDAVDEDNDQEDETDGDGGASEGDGDAVVEDDDQEDVTDTDGGTSDGDSDAVDEDNEQKNPVETTKDDDDDDDDSRNNNNSSEESSERSDENKDNGETEDSSENKATTQSLTRSASALPSVTSRNGEESNEADTTSEDKEEEEKDEDEESNSIFADASISTFFGSG